MHSLKKRRSLMDKDTTELQDDEISCNAQELMDRRDFLHSLKKWSKIVIGGALAGSALLNHGTKAEAAGWANRGGGGGGAWANKAGGGGAAVVHPGGGTAWANKAGGGGAAWANRGAAWANRGSAWVNRF
jgi:hypothetical protein